MRNFLTSDDIKELLASYVLGDLTPEEVAQVKQLLDSNPQLEEEVKSLEKTLALFPLALPDVESPLNLGDRILASAQAATTNVTQFKAKKPVIWSIMGTMVASVIVTLGFSNYRLQKQVIATQEELSVYQEAISLLRQPNNNLVSLQGTQFIPNASGSLVVIPQSQTIFLTVQNLTPLPEGKIYRLWGVVDNKKVFCGEFIPDQQGNILIKLPLEADMSNSSSVVVTIEPSQKLSYPIGETVMISNPQIYQDQL